MSDIFREVEEEVRKERLDQIWKDYGDYIVAAACLVVIGAAGLQLWRTYDHNQRIKASDQYAAAQAMMDGNEPTLAAEAFGHLADTAPSGYKELARLQHADALMASGERGDALNLYTQIASDSDPVLAAIARLHHAWAIADYAPRAEVATTLGTLDDAGSPWRPLAQEVLAYWDYRSGNKVAALADYDAINKTANLPSGLKERASIMAKFLRAGGDTNYGTVPAPPAPPEPAGGQVPTDPTTGAPIPGIPDTGQAAAVPGGSGVPPGPTAPNPNVAPNPTAPGHP